MRLVWVPYFDFSGEFWIETTHNERHNASVIWYLFRVYDIIRPCIICTVHHNIIRYYKYTPSTYHPHELYQPMARPRSWALSRGATTLSALLQRPGHGGELDMLRLEDHGVLNPHLGSLASRWSLWNTHVLECHENDHEFHPFNPITSMIQPYCFGYNMT